MAIIRQKVHFETNPNDLCETFSTENFKLLQVDTGILYGHSCIDPIAGFDEHGKPFSRHEYEETDQKDEDEDNE